MTTTLGLCMCRLFFRARPCVFGLQRCAAGGRASRARGRSDAIIQPVPDGPSPHLYSRMVLLSMGSTIRYGLDDGFERPAR